MTKQLIVKYIEGKCTSAEIQYILNHFRIHPEDIELYFNEDEGKIFIEKSENIVPITFNSDELFQKIRKKTVIRSKKLNNGIRLGIGVLIITLLSTTILFWNNKSSPNNSLIVTQNTTQKSSNIRWFNNSSQIQTRVLPDSSRVQLYPNSEIKYVSNFDTIKKRNITLIGKAYFEVAHAPEKPFTVICNGISTTALGTKFEITGRDDVTVSLIEGKVVVQKLNDPNLTKQYLLPYEKVFYTAATNQLRKVTAPAVKKPNLIIKNTSETAVPILNLADALDDWAYTFKTKVGYNIEIINQFKISEKDKKSVQSWSEAMQLIENKYQLHNSTDSTGIYRIK